MLKNVWQIIDALIFILSPFAILTFIVGMILLIDAYSQHRNFVHRLNTEGLIAQADITGLNADFATVEFTDAAKNKRYAILETEYYPASVVQRLKQGTDITIRYLPELYEADVILANYLETVRGYAGHLTGYLIVMAVCWVWVIIHPEFLYIGYEV